MNKKKLYLIISLTLALALGIGAYAYTYSSGAEIIEISSPTGDIATSNTSLTQPDWDSVLTPIFDSYTFRPQSAGNETGIDSQFPASGAHWDKVDESSSDDDGTFVYTGSVGFQEDLYEIPDHSTQTAAGPISYVRVYMEASSTTDNITQTSLYAHIKTNGSEYNGSSQNITLGYATYYYQWTTNPQTSANWTWSEIDALQIGVGLRTPNVGEHARVTQVYAVVAFEAPPLAGSTSLGDLFTVYPNSLYTGDFSVKLYLINTNNVTKAFKFINIRVYLVGSAEASQTPNYRTLTLNNGVVAFWLDNAGSDNRTMSVTGGTYELTSREPAEWSANWSATPEFFMEITQR